MSKRNRRTFLAGMSALTAGGSGFLAGLIRAPQAEASPQLRRPASSGGQLESLDAKAAEVPLDYPRPSYLPAGFVRTSTWRDYPGGFMAPGEIVQYFHRSGEYERQGRMTFLALFIAPLTKNRPQFEAQDRTPERISLHTTAGDPIEAEYYDGVWQLNQLPNPPVDRIRTSVDGHALLWNTDNFHSLLFVFHGYSVLIHGCRYAGIDRDQLLKIATSFTDQR